MLSNIISRSTAAFGGAPFRLNKCTALTSAAGGAASGAAVGGVPGALAGCFLRIGIPLFYPCDEQGGRDVPEVGYVLEEVHVGGGDAEYFDIPVPAAIW